jgi:hypothetical protein
MASTAAFDQCVENRTLKAVLLTTQQQYFTDIAPGFSFVPPLAGI